MEEVWKDISITSLPNTPIPHIIHNQNPHFKGMILQDFFNRKNPLTKSSMDPQIIKPNTLEFQFFENHEMMNPKTHHNQNFQVQGNSSVSGLMGLNDNDIPSMEVFASSSGFNKGFNNQVKKKRLSMDGGCDDEDDSVDRRHKRMIKNRESAARSRARKQAYVTELELEVAHLTKENAMLRKQQRLVRNF
ncbi:protein FD-like isoform X1 [Amaranthus tricolor]|uniref:protein FD-like isoform X1 n=1 Tax=Amaranthus tricolor TaxID=29722 RepID=UPI00258A41CE|nr:protein FD-like isoform X1 [Amaranthus tricolor]